MWTETSILTRQEWENLTGESTELFDMSNPQTPPTNELLSPNVEEIYPELLLSSHGHWNLLPDRIGVLQTTIFIRHNHICLFVSQLSELHQQWNEGIGIGI